MPTSTRSMTLARAPAAAHDGEVITELQASSIRVGDAERQAVVAALGEHVAAGRLDLGEYDERVVAAYAARTRADLAPLLADLPAGVRRSHRPPAMTRAAGLPVPLLVLLAVLVLVAVTAVAGFPPFFLVPALFWASRSRHRHQHRQARRS